MLGPPASDLHTKESWDAVLSLRGFYYLGGEQPSNCQQAQGRSPSFSVCTCASGSDLTDPGGRGAPCHGADARPRDGGLACVCVCDIVVKQLLKAHPADTNQTWLPVLADLC